MLRNPVTHKNIKFFYYLNGTFLEFLRILGSKSSRDKWLRIIDTLDLNVLEERLAYYNKIEEPFALDTEGFQIGDLSMPKKNKAYYFDLLEFAQFFEENLRIAFQFGDVTKIPEVPSIVKSRPISKNNYNAVLFKLNKIRHYTFTNDRINYSQKKNLLIGRASVKQEHRRAFLRQYFEHPMCDLGQINSGTQHDQWLKKKISINDHLKHKFIWCQEGNDVASNLKWVMSSNSIAIMPKPKYETWFMEGTLIPHVHFIPLKDDYSDLEEQLNYYLNHEKEALQIIANANAYVQNFRNSEQEKTLCFLVMDKYFSKSGQVKPLLPKWY